MTKFDHEYNEMLIDNEHELVNNFLTDLKDELLKVRFDKSSIEKNVFKKLSESTLNKINEYGVEEDYLYDLAMNDEKNLFEDENHDYIYLQNYVSFLEHFVERFDAFRTELIHLKRHNEMTRQERNTEFSHLYEKFKAGLRDRGLRKAENMKKKHIGKSSCPYCLQKTKKTELHADHIIPITRLGLSEEENMVLICSKCNVKKGKSSLYTFCKREGLNYEDIAERLISLGKWV